MRHLSFVACMAIVAGCSDTPKTLTDPVTTEAVKALDPKIGTVTITTMIDGKNAIGIELQKDPLTGGAIDWNSLAISGNKVAVALSSATSVARLDIDATSPANGGAHWAHIRYRIPVARGTYLERFAQAEATGAGESAAWLCEFYKKYSSARPAGQASPQC